MTPDPAQNLPALKITTKVIDGDEYFWLIRATAKFEGTDYVATHSVRKDVYVFSIPTVMARLVHEVAHQIVVTAVGQTHASDDRR